MKQSIMQKRNELFFGLVGAVGTDLEKVSESLQHSLQLVNYTSEVISLSHILEQIEGLGVQLKTTDEYERIYSYMSAGNKLRNKLSDGSALSILAIGAVRDSRESKGQPNQPVYDHAYIFRSLKHPKEIEKLREIYGKNFWLLSAYSPRHIRVDNLTQKIISSHKQTEGLQSYRYYAELLIDRDEHEVGENFGQDVRNVFPEADVFIDATNLKQLSLLITRFIELIFGNTFHTPAKEEYGMFHAYASSLRSSSLARQVGSSITTLQGDVISTGTNEVPKAGGGVYDPDDQHDRREFRLRVDSNDKKKQEMLGDVLKRLARAGWLKKEKSRIKIDDLVKLALNSEGIKDIQIMNLTEFGREVHAEMAAIVDAARRTISVNDCILYCTTFPCHICAKHIIASGIGEVVYIEPYPKSLAKELFADSMILDGADASKVNFKSFVGISPRRFMDLFTMLPRKDDDGKIIPWDGPSSRPRFSEAAEYYILKEQKAIKELKKKMITKNLDLVNK